MGQKEKARAIVAEKFEFSVSTQLSADEWIAAARKAAEASKTRINGKIKEFETETSDGFTTMSFAVNGPGGIMQLMSFVIFGKANEGAGSHVNLSVGDFVFQKGSLGMKPTINAAKVMTKFVTLFKAELAAA